MKLTGCGVRKGGARRVGGPELERQAISNWRLSIVIVSSCRDRARGMMESLVIRGELLSGSTKENDGLRATMQPALHICVLEQSADP